MQYDLSLYGCGQILQLNDFCVVFTMPSSPTLCCDCGVPVRLLLNEIVSPWSQLHAVLTFAITGEALWFNG